jgi:lipopolysaccharide export system protein LptA
MRLQRIAFHRAVRILSGILPVVIVAFVCVAVWNYWARTRDLPTTPTHGGTVLPPDVAVQTGAFTFESYIGDQRKFLIKGSELVVLKDNRNLLSNVDVLVYGQKAGDPDRRIHGDKCSYAKKTEDDSLVRCDGNVSVELDPGTIAYTQELHYDSKTGMISSPGATRLERPGHMTGTAGQMQYLIDTGLLRLSNRADIELTEGGSLHTGIAIFQQKENWVTVSQGIEMKSANGWLKGGSGRADLAPGTYRPTNATIENGASMESRSPRSLLKMKSDWLQSDLTAEGKPKRVLARGGVVAENKSTGDDKSLGGTLSGPEIEMWMSENGRPDVIEARQHPKFESDSDKVELTAENTIHIDYGPRSIKTDGASSFTGETNSITGRDFVIETDEKKNERIFSTLSRATLESPDMKTEADKTKAHIDGATNKIVSLEQTGQVKLTDKKAARSGKAGKLTVKGDQIVLEQDNPEVIDGQRILKGKTLTIWQADKKFVADGNVTMADMSSKAKPVVILADHAEGDESRINYTGKVQLFPGDGQIDAGHLVAYAKENRFIADGGVSSKGTGFHANSRELEFIDKGDAGQTAHYTGGVSATQTDKQGVSFVLNTHDLEVNLKSGQMETLVATKGADVTQGAGLRALKGHADRVNYNAATGDIVLTGTEAAEAEIRRGVDVVKGCIIQIQKSGGEQVTPCAGRSIKSSIEIKKN